MTIGDWLGRREALTPESTALLDAARRAPLATPAAITYKAWNRRVNRAATWLKDRFDVTKGDRIAVLAMNSVDVLDVWFACGKLGAVFQPLNWRLTPAELGPQIVQAGPRALLYGADFIERARALRRSLAGSPGAPRFAALDEGALASSDDPYLAERDAASDAPPPPVELGWDDPWVLCSTGGSTGAPKGALLTHGNITWNAINTAVSWGLSTSDVTLLNAPLFHTGGLNVLTAPLVFVGGISVVCRSFDANQVLDLIERARVTVLFGVPTMFLSLLEDPRFQSTDLTGLRFVISGGAPCPPPVFDAFRARGVEFKTGYGLTEAGPNTFWLPSEFTARKPGCVGAPLFHVEARVEAEGEREASIDEVGELLIRGPHVFSGYLGRPDETAHAKRGGWLHTGDLARRDADGHFWIAGRIKDIIISGGENIYPSEVEGVLAAHPSVAEAAVIGVPDPRFGEVGRAVLVLREGEGGAEPPSAEAILAFCQGRLAKYKTPKSAVFIDALPKTAAGKVDKRALSERFGGRADNAAK